MTSTATTTTIIACPTCGEQIPLSEALTAQLRAGLEQEYETKYRQGLAAVEERSRRDAEERYAVQVQELVEALKRKETALEEATRNELDLRRKARELEDRQKALDLEVARRVDEARAAVEQDMTLRLGEEVQRKVAEKDLQLEAMRRQIEDLKRKAEQGSQQLQGEVLEVELETVLAQAFPDDRIEPVPKGVRGADLMQHVHLRGVKVGTIVWESKRTKAWQDGWLPKLREDQRAVSADCAVLVSEILPPHVRHFACIDSVWVATPLVAVPVAVALRHLLQQVHAVRQTAIGKGEKMELLYDYVTGTRFRQRVQGLVEAFIQMREEHEKEKRTVQRTWASRERLQDRMMAHTAGFYGDLCGLVGGGIPDIPTLRLEGGQQEDLPGAADAEADEQSR